LRARLGFLLLAVGLGALTLGRAPSAWGGPEEPDALYAEHLEPFLTRYCFECHQGADPEGELRLDLDRSAAALAAQRETWERVRSVLHAGEMPPPEAKRHPAAHEVAAVSSAIAAALRVDSGDPGRVTVRRLNRAEYDNTLRDLLGLHLALSEDFPDDDVGYGYDTVGDVLTVSPLLLERYLAAAEHAAGEAFPHFAPLDVRVEAEAATRQGRGGVRDGWAVLSTNGQFATRVDVPWDGEFLLEAHVYGDQAGPDPVELAFRLDGARVARRRVHAVRDEPRVYRTRLALTRGRHQVAVAFTNDYWQPEDPDPAQRDRNMAVDWIAVRGPLQAPRRPWAYQRYVQRLPDPDASPAERAAIARETLAPLASRAWRRPVRDDELSKLVALVELAHAEGDPWERGLQVALQAILVSPAFLYRFELDARPNDPTAHRDLNDHELASRLSYFLWSSMPDDELTALAQQGRLRDQLAQQTHRLLDDPKVSGLVQNFFGQCDAFPEFDEPLRDAMRIETELVCEAILREGRGVLDLLGARFSFVNERLARHYGLVGVRGPRFRRVSLPPERGGVITHASVLTVTSNPTRTSPVKRGKWLLERILADPPPPPPPGVGALVEPGQGEARGATLREQLEAHRQLAECRICHDRMDNLGFGLESFDGVGGWRSHVDGEPIDDAGSLPDGATFEGPQGLREYLLANARAFVRGLAEQLLIYALGRGPAPADAPALDRLVDSLGPNPRLEDLIVRLVQLDAFTKRRGEEAE
jgi:hypothetical protein